MKKIKKGSPAHSKKLNSGFEKLSDRTELLREKWLDEKYKPTDKKKFEKDWKAADKALRNIQDEAYKYFNTHMPKTKK